MTKELDYDAQRKVEAKVRNITSKLRDWNLPHKGEITHVIADLLDMLTILRDMQALAEIHAMTEVRLRAVELYEEADMLWILPEVTPVITVSEVDAALATPEIA